MRRGGHKYSKIAPTIAGVVGPPSKRCRLAVQKNADDPTLPQVMSTETINAASSLLPQPLFPMLPLQLFFPHHNNRCRRHSLMLPTLSPPPPPPSPHHPLDPHSDHCFRHQPSYSSAPFPNSQALYSFDSDSDFYSNYPYPEDSFFDFFSSSTSLSSTLKPIVDSLPVVEIADSASCSICMDEFELGTGASQLPCKHFFHKDCIAPWLDRSKTCPLCRRQLPNEGSEKPLHSNWGFTVAELEAIQIAGSELERSLAILGSADFDDISGWRIDPMHDADGDTLMVDAAL